MVFGFLSFRMLWSSVTGEKKKCHSHHPSLNTLNILVTHCVINDSFVIMGPIIIIFNSLPIFEWFQSNIVTMNREIGTVPR